LRQAHESGSCGVMKSGSGALGVCELPRNFTTP
jgi:hypothetical protein